MDFRNKERKRSENKKEKQIPSGPPFLNLAHVTFPSTRPGSHLHAGVPTTWAHWPAFQPVHTGETFSSLTCGSTASWRLQPPRPKLPRESCGRGATSPLLRGTRSGRRWWDLLPHAGTSSARALSPTGLYIHQIARRSQPPRRNLGSVPSSMADFTHL